MGADYRTNLSQAPYVCHYACAKLYDSSEVSGVLFYRTRTWFSIWSASCAGRRGRSGQAAMMILTASMRTSACPMCSRNAARVSTMWLISSSRISVLMPLR